MRHSKEQRVINHSQTILEKLEKVSSNGSVTVEYKKLFEEYKKLNRRYEKTMKQADSMGNSVMQKKDSLSDNLSHTIKVAREKLMDNIVEHRKTKESSNKYMLKLKMLEKSYDELYEQNAVNEKKLKLYIKNYGNLKETFYTKESEKESTKLDINPPFYRNKKIHQVILLESPQDKSNFVLAKIGLKDYDKVLSHVEQVSSVNTFLLAISKYIKSYVNEKEGFLFHHREDEFYLLSYKDVATVKEFVETLNTKREVMDIQVSFIATITKFIEEEDTEEIILQRCDYAFSKLRKGTKNIMLV
jgi:hypothetical protein